MQRPRRKPRSRFVTAVLWGVLLPVCGVVGLGWLLGGWVYWLDLMAAMQAQLCGLLGLVALLGLVLGRWRFVALIVALLGSGLLPLLQGRALMLPSAGEAENRTDTIRVVSVNINPVNERWDEALTKLMWLDADVIVLIEVPPELNRSIKNRGRLDGTRYPHWTQRHWVDQETSPCFVLSRWAIEKLDVGGDPLTSQHALHARIDAPSGPFVVGVLHPLSPRNQQRWAQGNRVIEMQCKSIVLTQQRTQLPMMIGADLNSAPAQHRSRVLRNCGIHQTKPVLRLGGSYPAEGAVPDTLMIQIDDVWRIGPAQPIAWQSIEVIGSDHRGVLVDFTLGAD